MSLFDILRHDRRTRRELAELKNLLTRLSAYADSANETCAKLCLHALGNGLSSHIDDLATTLCIQLLRYEGYTPLLEVDSKRQLSTGELWDSIESARRQLEFYESPQRQGEIAEILALYVKYLVQNPPEGEDGEETLAFVPLHSLHPHLAYTLDGLIPYTIRTGKEKGIFSRLGMTLFNNLLVASGIDPEFINETRKLPVMPTEAKDKSSDKLVDAYLARTPFTDFLKSPIPFSIPLSSRFEHTHIVGGSGHGKTQLLQSFLINDLQKLKDAKASIIVIDSQGDMIRNIRQLALVGDVPERVVLIDPYDIAYPPALNFFDFGLDRVDRYSPVERETLINGAIALYEYVFGALLGAELTQRQGVIFRYLARLMMVVPGATIHTLMQFMEEPESTRPYVDRLDPIAKHFFESQFYTKKFDDTRQQILTRLWGVLSNSVLARMFANERNKLNLFEAMNSGSLILINTAKELLKQDGCEIIGRFFIAMICQAAQERASIPEHRRQDTFVYIDEAHDYFDESMENLLNQARKYKVGLVLAHQNLDQFETKLRSTVMASTSIKMVGGLSATDAAIFAREMNCEREYLQSVRKHADRTEFACNVRNHTPNPVSLSVPFGSMERQPKITAEKAAYLLEHNRARYCAGAEDRPMPALDRTIEANSLEKPELL